MLQGDDMEIKIVDQILKGSFLTHTEKEKAVERENMLRERFPNFTLDNRDVNYMFGVRELIDNNRECQYQYWIAVNKKKIKEFIIFYGIKKKDVEAEDFVLMYEMENDVLTRYERDDYIEIYNKLKWR